jgi:signal transduction histidine kinase
MAVPLVPIIITPEQLKELNQHLSNMRHEINNQLSLIVAALELMRYKPDMREKLLETLGQQPPKITAEVAKFSAEFERTFGIVRESASSAQGFI